MTSKNYLSLFTIFGGFAPNSETAETLSKALGTRTVMSGSISRGKNDPSQSLQMMERPLLTADELKSLKKGNFVVMKTGAHPMQTKLKLFLDWGITFDKIYETQERFNRKVYYANKEDIEENIQKTLSNTKLTALYETKENSVAYEEVYNESIEEKEINREKSKNKFRP